MSSLRDRLKKIADARSDLSPPTGSYVPKTCARREIWVSAPRLDLQEEVLGLILSHPAQTLSQDELLYLDTETTGLSRGVGTIAFQIGIGEQFGDQMRITQYWLRDYNEEEDMLRCVLSHFVGKRALVTFNGKAFDVPLLESRCILSHITFPLSSLLQIDLVHPTRRVYKLRLKDCSLAHIEEVILGVRRQGDIPGALIPALWTQYLQNGDDSQLLCVLEHNANDVRSMAYLLQTLVQAHANPLAQSHAGDLFSVGRVYERAGGYAVAEKCYKAIQDSVHGRVAGVALSRIYRRQGRQMERLDVLLNMAGEDNIAIYIELAKLYEHKLHDIDQAIAYTERAMEKARTENEMHALIKRRMRLSEKRIRRNAQNG